MPTLQTECAFTLFLYSFCALNPRSWQSRKLNMVGLPAVSLQLPAQLITPPEVRREELTNAVMLASPTHVSDDALLSEAVLQSSILAFSCMSRSETLCLFGICCSLVLTVSVGRFVKRAPD